MQEAALWQAVLGELELSMSKGNFVTWFPNTRLLKVKDGVASVGVPNIFIKNQLEKKFTDVVLESLIKSDGNITSLEFKIHSGITMNNRRIEDDSMIFQNQEPVHHDTKMAKAMVNTLQHGYRQGLNEKYTFENFIVGSGSELAYAACQAVASSPGTKYNPLFLYGGVGIGKTHLIQAVGNEIMKNDHSKRVVYISSEQFVQEFLDAIRFKKNTEFAGYYRSADVLIIDDMQFIAGKEKTQEEFFHTFNALHQANKQIIISSDKPPKDIPTLEERLRSRFEWGMSIDMQAPDFETRCAIIQSKAHEQEMVLEPDVVDYLARYVQTNIRELEGILNQVLAFCEIRKIHPDLAAVQEILGSQRQRPKHVAPKQIIEKTARYFQIDLSELLGPKRDKEIVVPRQVAMYLLRSELHLSFPKIAEELGRKDHTTAMHSVEKITGEAAINSKLQEWIADIKEKIYA